MKVMGLVLAGGSSTRMKQDKADLIINNQTLLSRQVRLLEKVCGEGVYVSGNRPGYRYLLDEKMHIGPLEGIRRGVECAIDNDFDKLVVIPVDMPMLNHELLLKMISNDSSLDAVRVVGEQFPILINNLAKVKNILNDMFKERSNSKNDFSIKKLLSLITIGEIQWNRSDLVNTNTPEEWNDAISKTNHFA